MSFSELTTHLNRYTNLFSTTQTTQILYPQHRKKITEATKTTYFLTNGKNILTKRFQSIQRLQPNFTTDGIRNFVAQQKQRKQPILIDGKNIIIYCLQPIQRLQPNFTTEGIRNFMAQQKQRKQLYLTDDKNIFTYCFQSIQRLQPNSKTYAIRNFMYIKHNEDNSKLRIFIPQR